jgi:ACS family pantothenate transporter-like MFS transporter
MRKEADINTHIGASSVLFAFWGIILYPATDAATVSSSVYLPFLTNVTKRLTKASQGFHKGTIAMVVVAVLLALWIGVVWWQDKRSLAIVEAQQRTLELETAKDPITTVNSNPDVEPEPGFRPSQGSRHTS